MIDPRVKYHPLKEWKKETIYIEGKAKAKVKRYVIKHQDRPMALCRNLKEVKAFIKKVLADSK